MTNLTSEGTFGPSQPSERIGLLDSLRGIAVLGILLMNIPAFSLPFGQIYDPFVKDEMSGPNFYAYFIPEFIFEGTQRALFSMLFGASMLLFLSRLQQKMDGLVAVEYYVRRQLWLLLFGLFNAYVLLWYWDILFHYAIVGMVLLAFRRAKPSALVAAAAVCILLMTARENVQFWRDKRMVARGEAALAIDTTKTKRTPAQNEAIGALQGFKDRMKKEGKLKRLENNIKQVQQGTYGDVYLLHSDKAYETETAGLFYFQFWDILVFMFIGMAFYKMGWMTGDAPLKVYLSLAVIGLGIGIPLSYLRLYPMLSHNYNYYEVVKDGGMLFYQISRSVRSLGIFGLIMVIYKSGAFQWLFSLLRPVGSMALTNYLMQSVLCGLFFYGFGFGYFGKLQRYEGFYVVAVVWVIQIIFSHTWRHFFTMGPVEWSWRNLTYWKIHPIRRRGS